MALTKLGALVVTDPVKVRDLILAAFAAHAYVAKAAASALEIEYTQLARLIARLKLGDEIDARRVASGAKVRGRPPRTVSRAVSRAAT